MSAPAFHRFNPSALRLFACAACQRDVLVLLKWVFGIQTFLCLCPTCAAAVTKKWPEAWAIPVEPAAPGEVGDGSQG